MSTLRRVRTIILFGILTSHFLSPSCHANPETVSFSFSTVTRAGAQAGYFRHYVPSEGYAATMGFTGNVTTSNPGTVSATFLNDCQRRINYYRVQAGLPGDITLNAAKNAKSQWAALIMSQQDDLSHTPASDWPLNAAVMADKAAHGGVSWGNEAAASASIALGSFGPGALLDFIIDTGPANGAAGHRRWILNPSAHEMGIGSIPPQGTFSESTCLWVIPDSFAPALMPKVVPWPNAGFIPYSQMPNPSNSALSGEEIRWSCSYTKGDFSGASVSVQRTSGPGSPVSVPTTNETYTTWVGDNALVWQLNNDVSLVPPSAGRDISYSVVISNIKLMDANPPPPEFVSTGSGRYRYSYSVTSFDENFLPTPPTLLGTPTPAVGLNNPYAVNQLPESSGLRIRAGSLSTSAWTEGAEDPAPTTILDGTTGYTLRAAAPAPVFAGMKVFHLAIPSLTASLQTFTITRDFIPSASSHLQFKNRFRFISSATALKVEASLDGGGTWQAIWQRSPATSILSSNQWESAYQAVDDATALAVYAGRVIRLRFSLASTDGIVSGIDNNFGVFIDAITVTNAQDYTIVTQSEHAYNATTCLFSPTSTGTYVLQSQMAMGDTHWFDYGPLTTVDAVAPTALQTWRNSYFGVAANADLAADTSDADKDGLSNLVEYAFGLNPMLMQPPNADLPKLSKVGQNIVFSFRPSPLATGLSYIVQKSSTLLPGSWSTAPHTLNAGLYSATIPMAGARMAVRLQITNASGL